MCIRDRLQQLRKNNKAKQSQNRSRKRNIKSPKPSFGDCVNGLAQGSTRKEPNHRAPIRWQHRLKREPPTCTERNESLLESADGSMATAATRRKKKRCFTK